jgi:hypothetical protein
MSSSSSEDNLIDDNGLKPDSEILAPKNNKKRHNNSSESDTKPYKKRHVEKRIKKGHNSSSESDTKLLKKKRLEKNIKKQQNSSSDSESNHKTLSWNPKPLKKKRSKKNGKEQHDSSSESDNNKKTKKTKRGVIVLTEEQRNLLKKFNTNLTPHQSTNIGKGFEINWDLVKKGLIDSIENGSRNFNYFGKNYNSIYFIELAVGLLSMEDMNQIEFVKDSDEDLEKKPDKELVIFGEGSSLDLNHILDEVKRIRQTNKNAVLYVSYKSFLYVLINAIQHLYSGTQKTFHEGLSRYSQKQQLLGPVDEKLNLAIAGIYFFNEEKIQGKYTFDVIKLPRFGMNNLEKIATLYSEIDNLTLVGYNVGRLKGETASIGNKSSEAGLMIGEWSTLDTKGFLKIWCKRRIYWSQKN